MALSRKDKFWLAASGFLSVLGAVSNAAHNAITQSEPDLFKTAFAGAVIGIVPLAPWLQVKLSSALTNVFSLRRPP